MMQDSAKPLSEADSEVSEAIDFALYYAKALEEMPFGQEAIENAKTVVVATPWNFPCAIPTSAILSSIACGHSVCFKPAPEAVLVGWVLSQALWEAGISKRLLQFITTDDAEVGTSLIQDPRVDKVILTGATETARYFLKMRPTLKLFAETGGKNAIIVTSLADRDLAVRDIVHSAFSYSGQKCSACSLLVLEEEVYYDKSFSEQLIDATTSLIVGSTWDLATEVGPLIQTPQEKLFWALKTLDPGESWLVAPKEQGQKNLFSCGITYGVKPGSRRHMTEFFGPVLSVLCAKNLKNAIDIVNSTPYGLTSGIQTLDFREQKFWQQHIVAGNCYINRTITGAIVGRQPFGGTKASSFGIGMKVGGPNYLMQFVQRGALTSTEACFGICDFEKTFCSILDKDEAKAFREVLCSYALWHTQYFSKRHSMRRLVGQDNYLYFTPRNWLFLLFHDNDTLFDVLCILSACLICGCTATIGMQDDLRKKCERIVSLLERKKLIVMNYDEAVTHITRTPQAHIRALSYPQDAHLNKIAAQMGCFDVTTPSRQGRLELLHYMREVSLSNEYHRYGNFMGYAADATGV